MTARHYLDSLLKPGSIAVLGASRREGSVGRKTMVNLIDGQFPGALYAVNPGYEDVLGVPCFPSLDDLPETAELVVLTVADARVEDALRATIDHGAKAVVLMSGLALDDGSDPNLRSRVQTLIEGSGLVCCGANSMGFYHFTHGIRCCGFATRTNHRSCGNVSYISHSGSGMAGILDCEERIDFNLAVSTGQEMQLRMDQYIEYALQQAETEVIGLFMETARNPAGMCAALQHAAERGIPVVALKVGRTEFSARLAISHSGAIAGSDDAYQAVFDRYGVHRVGDMHEMAATLSMFAQPHAVGPGGLVCIHDSGGERQLLIDLADEMNIDLTTVSETTRQKLAARLDPGLPPVNPLDAWGDGGLDADTIMEDAFADLLCDPGASIGAVVHDRGPNSQIYHEYTEYIRVGHRAAGKPAFMVTNHQGSGMDDTAVELGREGFPVIDGIRPFLTGVRHLFNHRDYQAQRAEKSLFQPELPCDLNRLKHWQARLSTGCTLNEYESGQLLSDFGINVNRSIALDNETGLINAAGEMEYPLVLKTAEPGKLHKTEFGGVRLDLNNESELIAAYRDLAKQLGPSVLLCSMIASSSDRELLLGVSDDEQFGPLVVLGFGGVQVESLRDIACAMPPFTPAVARTMLDRLRLRPLLEASRGQAAADIEAFCQQASRLSVIAHFLGDFISEIDINPVIVQENGCIAVDALVVGKRVSSTHEI